MTSGLPNYAWEGAVETPVSSRSVTASGTIAALSGYGPATSLRAQLAVTAVTGTSPTLNVVIEDTLDATNWNTVGTFTQVTAVGTQVINVTTPFGDTLRVRWTVAGTNPNFTFSVVWIAQV